MYVGCLQSSFKRINVWDGCNGVCWNEKMKDCLDVGVVDNCSDLSLAKVQHVKTSMIKVRLSSGSLESIE